MDRLTFRELEQRKAMPSQPSNPGASSLGDWYESVRTVPLSELSIKDLCRSIRQKLFLNHTLLTAATRLKENPIAGELYDGELAVAVSGLSLDKLDQHPAVVRDILPLLRDAVSQASAITRSDLEANVRRVEERFTL